MPHAIQWNRSFLQFLQLMLCRSPLPAAGYLPSTALPQSLPCRGTYKCSAIPSFRHHKPLHCLHNSLNQHFS
ncbi:hypothetical protein KC19_11G032400 [Ceratodon purpureus]|uniref:Secreted protein n=1 Tax=Ceratodon purpureus TaxID=3225 RepID=A0A8T0GDK8_CERPU|nr:hypothetical protein KC19_11G032400 [Ceratodon purpureus]